MKAYHSILSNLPPSRTEKIETTFLRFTILSVDLAASSDALQLRCIAAIGKAAQILGDRPDVKLSQDTIQAVAMVWAQIKNMLVDY